MAEKHVSDFKLSPDQIVLDLINHDNASSLTLELIELGIPYVAAGSEALANTEMEVTAVEGSGYKGSVVVNYNRLEIQDFVPIMVGENLTLPVGDAVNFSDLIGEINVALDINLTEEDYIDGPIGDWVGTPNETKEVTIAMNASSRLFIGGLTLTIKAEDIHLSEVIPELLLGGLNLPEVPALDVSEALVGPLDGFDNA